MKYYENVLELIGNTPLVKLNRMVDSRMATVLAKMEQLNPGGSVKDRMAHNMVRRAEEAGTIKPGMTLVESTSGNTGLGLAMTAAVKGYRCIFTMPDKMSKEKIDMLKAYGSEVVVTRTDLDHDHPDSYVSVAKRIAKETPGGFYTDQYFNMSNPEAHYQTTGPEIWRQTGGKVDGFICAIGTGGTLAGIGIALKERNADVVIGLADPMGAAMYSYFTTGELVSEGSSITEGIGQGRVTGNVAEIKLDEAFQIPDEEALPVLFDLLKHEGLCLGPSTGINVAGAIRLARKLGPGHTIVTILADGGQRYQSKLFNPAFLKEKNLPAPDWL